MTTTAVIVSVAEGFKNRNTGKMFYKVYAKLPNGTIGVFYRDQDHVPIEGDEVTFQITTDKDSKFVVRVVTA